MSKMDEVEYVAEMTAQLARFCQARLPLVARLLEIAAEMAREALKQA